jgi:hypothetical protein
MSQVATVQITHKVTTVEVMAEIRGRVAERIETLSYPDPFDNRETCAMMVRVLQTLSLWAVNAGAVAGTLADHPDCHLMSHLLGEALDCQLDLGPASEVEQFGRHGVIRW